MYSKHLFLYAFKPAKDKGYVDVKLNLLLEKVQRYTLPKLAQNHNFCHATGEIFFFFFLGGGGGGGGGGGLISETIKSINKKMLPWLLVLVRPVCNINMVEIGRPPSSDIF